MSLRTWRSCFSALIVSALVTLSGCTNTSNNAVPGSNRPDGGLLADGGDGGRVTDAPLDAPGTDGGAAVDAGFDALANGRPLGRLWFAGSGLGAFLREEITSSRDRGPGYIVQPAVDFKSFHDLAFDAAGNLWAIPVGSDQIIRVPALQLGRNAPPPFADVVIHSEALKGPEGLVFDGQGRLWVLNYAAAEKSIGSIVRFDDVKSASGPVTLSPSLTILPDASAVEQARFNQATGFSFDTDGNLWIAAVANVLRIDHAMALSGAVTAKESAVVTGGESYAGLTFDAHGSLWVTAAGGGYWAMRFDNPSALMGTVKPVPSAKVHLPAGTANFAGGIVEDSEGSLWVAMSNQLLKYSGAMTLSGEVTPTPAVVLGLVAFPDLASKLAFWPGP